MPPSVQVVTIRRRQQTGASSGSEGPATPPSKKRKRAGQQDRKSARYRAVIDDKDFEESVQSSYSITAAKSASTRILPLGVQAQRDGPAFSLPSLATLCLNIVAYNFGTHILPTQETFATAQARIDGRPVNVTPGRESKKAKEAKRAAQAKKNRAIATKMGKQMGLPGRIVPDSDEEDAEADYLPDEGEDDGVEVQPRSSRPSRATVLQPRPIAQPHPSSHAGELNPDELHFLTARNHQILKMLPAHHIERLQSLVLEHSPTSLTQRVLSAYFIAARPTLALSSDLALLTSQTSAAASLLQSADPTRLRILSLHGLTRLEDRALCSLLLKCNHLTSVTLRGCVRIGSKSATALVTSSARTLRELNVDSTDVGAEGVGEVIKHAPYLEVLKVASVQGLDDTSIPLLLDAAIKHQLHTSPPTIPLARLRTLKVRSTNVGDVSVSLLIKLCVGTLERLDVGFTHVGSAGNLDMLGMALGIQSVVAPEAGDGTARQSNLSQVPAGPTSHLRKLVLSGLTLHSSSLASFIDALCDAPSSRLDTLHLASVHARTDSRKHVSGPQAPLGPGVIGHACAAIQRLALRREAVASSSKSHTPLAFRKLVLAGNDGLVTVTGGASFMGDYGGPEECDLADLEEWPPSERLGVVLYHMGQICETLDLSSVSSPSTGGAPRLDPAPTAQAPIVRTRYLHLSDCRIADAVLFALATHAGQVRSLSLANCQVTPASIDAFITANPFLASLDLTGCRGVPVAKRRNYLAFFDEERQAAGRGE